jgi:hypothetical protein
VNIQPHRRTLVEHPAPPAKCGTTGHPTVAGRDPRQVASQAPDASTEPAATRRDHTLTSSDRGSPSRDGTGVKARSPALTTTTGTRPSPGKTTPDPSPTIHTVKAWSRLSALALVRLRERRSQVVAEVTGRPYIRIQFRAAARH